MQLSEVHEKKKMNLSDSNETICMRVSKFKSKAKDSQLIGSKLLASTLASLAKWLSVENG